MSVRSKLYACIVVLGLIMTAAAVNVRQAQSGPALTVSDTLSAGNCRLGLAGEAVGSTKQANFVEGKCISGSSSEFLTDGTSTLRRGFISPETLTKRLGTPKGKCFVAGSTVWIYDFPLKRALSNGRYTTSNGHLYVFVESSPFGLHLNNFELTIDGSGQERWPEKAS